MSWYLRRRRDLPWRRRPTPYRVWVSEIMLQQTTVATVIPYFDRFVRRFPDIRSLAAARRGDVLRSWAGLGYYSRARNLQKAARRLVLENRAKLPAKREVLENLPGIGRYTAGAILSIAFQIPAAVLDGNVIRVLSRLYAVKTPVSAGKTLARLWALAESLVPSRNPGDWNQALMELGATVCLPASPLCDGCPVKGGCSAYAKGIQDILPPARKRPKPIDLSWTCLWIERGTNVLLWRRSKEERFLGGHLGLPEARHLPATAGPLIKRLRHTITNHRIRVDLRRAELTAPPPRPARWVSRQGLKGCLVSSLWTKCLEGVL